MPEPSVTRTLAIELIFGVEDFPVVRREGFKPVLASTMEVSLYPDKNGALYVGRIQLRGSAVKKDDTPANAPGNMWFNSGPSDLGETPQWLLKFAQEQVHAALTGAAPTGRTEDRT